MTLPALALALFFCCHSAEAQLKFANFSSSQIKKCPASGKAKPPDAQRVNINGLPFSGAPWLKASTPRFCLPATAEGLNLCTTCTQPAPNAEPCRMFCHA